MKRFSYLLCATAMLLIFNAGCSTDKDELSAVPDQAEVSDSRAVLYPLETIQQIAADVLGGQTRSVPQLQATTQYVVFYPKTLEELDVLINRKDFDCSGVSILDLSILGVQERTDLPEETGRAYAFVKGGTAMPDGIEYEVLVNYYNPYDDNSGVMDSESAAEIVARAAEPEASTRVIGDGIGDARPTGTVTMMDNVMNQMVPMAGVSVTVVDINTVNHQVYIETLITDAQGRFAAKNNTYRLGCNFRIDWKYDNYVQKENATTLAGYAESFAKTNFNISIPKGHAAYRFAAAHRGIYAACKSDGANDKYKFSSVDYNAKIGVICSNTSAPNGREVGHFGLEPTMLTP